VWPEWVITNSMSTLYSLLNRFLISSEFESVSSHSPAGFFPTMLIQEPAFPLRVLMTPSTDVAPPPTAPVPPASAKRNDATGLEILAVPSRRMQDQLLDSEVVDIGREIELGTAETDLFTLVSALVIGWDIP
jgi:hypothetical protein